MKMMKYTFATILLGFLCGFAAPIQAMNQVNESVEKEKKEQSIKLLHLLVTNVGNGGASGSIVQGLGPIDTSLANSMSLMRFNNDGLIDLCKENGILLTHIFSERKVVEGWKDVQALQALVKEFGSLDTFFAYALSVALNTFFDPENSGENQGEGLFAAFPKLKDFESYVAGEFKEMYKDDISWKSGKDPISKMLQALSNKANNTVLDENALNTICERLNSILNKVKKPDLWKQKIIGKSLSLARIMGSFLVAYMLVSQSCNRNYIDFDKDFSKAMPGNLDCTSHHYYDSWILIAAIGLLLELYVYPKYIYKKNV